MADLTLEPDPAAGRETLVERLLHRRYLGDFPDPARARVHATVAADRAEARMLRVVGPDGRCGHVWVVADGDDLAVLDVTLADGGHAPATRALVEEHARAEGARRLVVGCAPGDLVTEAFVVGGGYEVRATQMRLDLDHDLPAEDAVVLAPMDDDRFGTWSAGLAESYVADRVAAGETPERAREVGTQQLAELLPRGLATEHQHLLVGQVEGAPVGMLWLSTDRPMVFVYDVEVHEEHRGRGFGTGLMRAGALWARARGAHAIGLNVFGHNHAARALYDGLGYLVTEHTLARRL